MDRELLPDQFKRLVEKPPRIVLEMTSRCNLPRIFKDVSAGDPSEMRASALASAFQWMDANLECEVQRREEQLRMAMSASISEIQKDKEATVLTLQSKLEQLQQEILEGKLREEAIASEMGASIALKDTVTSLGVRLEELMAQLSLAQSREACLQSEIAGLKETANQQTRQLEERMAEALRRGEETHLEAKQREESLQTRLGVMALELEQARQAEEFHKSLAEMAKQKDQQVNELQSELGQCVVELKQRDGVIADEKSARELARQNLLALEGLVEELQVLVTSAQKREGALADEIVSLKEINSRVLHDLTDLQASCAENNQKMAAQEREIASVAEEREKYVGLLASSEEGLQRKMSLLEEELRMQTQASEMLREELETVVIFFSCLFFPRCLCSAMTGSCQFQRAGATAGGVDG